MVAQDSEDFPGLRLGERAKRLWVDTSSGFENEVEKFYQAVENGDLEPFQISEGYAFGLRLLKALSLQVDRKRFK